MWKVAARCITFAVGCSLAACLPNFQGLISRANPPASTVELTPSRQLAATQEASASPAPTQFPTSTVAPTFTPIPTLTAATGSPTIATATPGTMTPSGTTALPAGPTSTAAPPESISLDKLQPGTVYKPVHIQNLSHSQMDISLHCTTIHGLHTVLEYNDVRNLTVQAPECDYIYVVYVGGRPMSGSFSLLHVPKATITVYADKVAIH